jgi:ankyrin repeat protein
MALIAAGANVCQGDNNGWTPLHFAAQNQAVEIAELLINAGAFVDAQDMHGNTPLSKAVFSYRGDGRLINLLRTRKANPLLKNTHGINAVELARTIANYDVRKYFDDFTE